MDEHQDEVEANVPELGRMMLACLQEIIQFKSLVAAFGGGAFVVHQMPLIAFPWRRGIEADVGFHGDGTGSAELGGRTRGLTGAVSVDIQGAAKLGILAAKIVAIGFHLQTGITDGDTIRADGYAMVIRSFLGIAKVEINEGGNGFIFAERIHSHGVMSSVEQKGIRF